MLDSRNRESLDLLVVTIASIVLAVFGVSLNYVENIYLFFYDYSSTSIAKFVINYIFLYLAGLLWVTFRRWKRADKKRKELEGVISSIDPDTLVVVDSRRNIVMCNNAIEKMFGYTSEEVIGRKIDMLYYDSQSYSKRWREMHEILGREGFHIELATGRRKDGQMILLEIVTGTLSSFNGVVSLLRDITERKKAEDAINRAYGELDQIFNTAADGMWVVDNTLTVVKVNGTFLTLLGTSQDHVVGKKCYEIFDCPQHLTPGCSLEQIQVGAQRYDCEVEMKPENVDRKITCLLTAAPFGSPVEGFNGIIEDFRDVTLLKEMENELRALSLVDELTGLYNRRGFLTLAGQQLKSAGRTKKGMLLIFVDIDEMKWINDTLGHHAGDQALTETAKILGNAVRVSDIVARIGGDEFVILAIEAQEDSLEVIGKRVQRGIEMYNSSTKREYRLSLSVGAAYYDPVNPCSIDEMLTRADKAMYEHKRSKKDL